MAPEYTPFSAVCSLTLTRSKGWPTRTAQTPPIPPAARERRLETDAFVAATTSVLTSSVEGREGAEVDEVVDIFGDGDGERGRVEEREEVR